MEEFSRSLVGAPAVSFDDTAAQASGELSSSSSPSTSSLSKIICPENIQFIEDDAKQAITSTHCIFHRKYYDTCESCIRATYIRSRHMTGFGENRRKLEKFGDLSTGDHMKGTDIAGDPSICGHTALFSFLDFGTRYISAEPVQSYTEADTISGLCILICEVANITFFYFDNNTSIIAAFK